MISYAQNFEDVILARAFKGQRQGFYIDVGVYHPREHSVTKHFYDLGWSGINVEALPGNFEVIRKARPRDINLNVAASTRTGPLQFHHIEATGLSTSRSDYAAQHASAGFPVAGIEVQTASLKAICDQHAVGRVIDFLKIDVEGAEADVVESADWTTYRPRILVIEATVPLSRELSHAQWEPRVLAAEYSFCYFDGLNRWYVRNEDLELESVFYAPPNPFDDYSLVRVFDLEREVALLKNRGPSLRKITNRIRGAVQAVGKGLRGRQT